MLLPPSLVDEIESNTREGCDLHHRGAAGHRCRRRFIKHLGVALILALLVRAAPASGQATSTIVVLVFDGFAPSLLEPEAPPALRRIQQEGSFTHHLIPEFPSSSSAGHFTLSTGCRPATHGIVSDEFIDPERGLYDGALDSSWLIACEHLHVAARRQGLRVATWDWFEESAAVEPIRRADDVVAALQAPPREKPQLIVAHFEAPLDTLRIAGLRSAQASQAVAAVDAIVGRVMQAIEALPAEQSATLFVTTNHGLLPVWTEVNLTRILRRHDLALEFTAAGATAFIYFPANANMQPAIAALSRYQRAFHVFPTHAAPAEWKLSANGRVGGLMLVAIPPYIIESERRWWPGTAWLAPFLPEMTFVRPFLKVSSGYPPAVRGMPGVLYAWGAGIAHKGEIARMNLIDVHPTIARLLGIQPGTPLDGAVVPELLPGAEHE